MTSQRFWASLLSVGVLIFFSCASLRAQSTFGTVDGALTDPSGAAIAGAKVTLTNTGTQETRAQATGDEGLYKFVNVVPGPYRLDFEKEGSSTLPATV